MPSYPGGSLQRMKSRQGPHLFEPFDPLKLLHGDFLPDSFGVFEHLWTIRTNDPCRPVAARCHSSCGSLHELRVGRGCKEMALSRKCKGWRILGLLISSYHPSWRAGSSSPFSNVFPIEKAKNCCDVAMVDFRDTHISLSSTWIRKLQQLWSGCLEAPKNPYQEIQWNQWTYWIKY